MNGLPVALFTLLFAGASLADTRSPREMGSDRFVAGSSVRVERAVAGDLLAAGGQVDVVAAVEGDAAIAGGNVRLGSRVGHALYAAGGQMTISGEVAGNARAAGGELIVAREAKVAGNASVAGGRVTVDGAIGGYLQAAGGEVTIDGQVDGDAVVAAETIRIGPRARIGGKLRYTSRDEPAIDPAAQITGGVQRSAWRAPSTAPARETAHRIGRGVAWLWTIGLMLLAALLVALLPALTSRVALAVRERLGWTALIGFVALVCIPAAAVILMITLVGLPIALVALFAYFALLLLGYVLGAMGLGDWVLRRLWPSAAASTGWRALAAALAVLALALLAKLPVVGGLFAFAALLIGLGALLLQTRPAHAA